MEEGDVFPVVDVEWRKAETEEKPKQLTKQTMSDTPETDGRCIDSDLSLTREVVCADFARRLERENNELRSKFTKLDKPRYSGSLMLDDVLEESSPDFDTWVASLPATYWARYDLSAARIGWEAARKFYDANSKADQER